MNDIRFVCIAPGRGELYVNGVLIPGVYSVVPDLMKTGEAPKVTITLAVKSFVLEPKK